MKKSITSLWNK